MGKYINFEEDYQKNKKNKDEKNKSSYINFEEEYHADMFRDSLSSRLESWEKEKNTLYDSYKSRFYDKDGKYINRYRGDTKSAYDTYLASHKKLDAEAQEILSFLEKHGGDYDEKYVTELKSYLTNNKSGLSSILDTYKSDNDYWSQWSDEDAYKRYQDQNNFSKKYEGKTYADLVSAKELVKKKAVKATGDELDALNRELDWLKNHKTDKQFADTMTDDELKQYKADNEGRAKELKSQIAKLKFEKYTYDKSGQWGTNNPRYLTVKNELESAEKELKALDGSVLYYDEAGAVTVDSLLTSRENEGILAEINGDEKVKSAYENALEASKKLKLVNNVINSEKIPSQANLEEAKRLQGIVDEFELLGYDFDSLEHYQSWKTDRENYTKTQEEKAEYAKEHPVLATLESIATAPLTAFEFLDNQIESKNYGYANIYDDDISIKNETYQGTVSNLINEAVYDSTNSELLSWLASSAYSGVTSATQSALTTAACTVMFGGAGASVALGVLGTEAGASTYRSAIMNGSTNQEALVTSVSAGIAEAMFEKLPLDNLLKVAKNGTVDSVSALLKGLAKQGLIEGTEELGTEIFNTMADNLINGDHSAYETAIKQYMKQGYSETDAKNMATAEWVEEVLTSFVGGMFGGVSMGGVVGGTSYAINNAKTNAYNRATGEDVIAKGNVGDLVEQAQPYVAENNALKKLADKVAGVNTEDMSKHQSKKYARSVGELYEGVMESKSKGVDATVTEAIKSEVEKTGFKYGTVATSAIEKALKGEELTEIEQSAFDTVNGADIIENISNAKTSDESINKKLKESFTGFDDVSNLKYKNNITVEEKNFLDMSGVEYTEDNTNLDHTGEEVKVEKIATLRTKDANGTITISHDGKTEDVDSGDLNLKRDVAVYYEGINQINEVVGGNLDIGVANELLGMMQTESDLTPFAKYLGVRQAFMYGARHRNVDALNQADFAKKLPQEIRDKAYNLAKKYNKDIAKAEQSKQKKDSTRKGSVSYAENIDLSNLTEEQDIQRMIATVFSEAQGVDLEFFKSEKGKQGEALGKRGSWTRGNNKMTIDIDVGLVETIVDKYGVKRGVAEGMADILNTLSHENVHQFAEKNPELFNKYVDALFEVYEKQEGVPSLEQLIEKETLKQKGDSQKAIEEIAARMSENFLRDILKGDERYLEAMAEMQKRDATLLDRVKEFLRNLADKIKAMLDAIADSKSAEAIAIQKANKEDLDRLHNMYKALLEACATENTTVEEQTAIEAFGDNLGTVETNENGDVTLITNKDNSTIMYSERTWNDGGKDALISALTRNEHTQEEINSTVDMIEDALDYLKILAAGDAQTRGYTELANHLVADITTDVIKGKQVLYTVVNNGDYPVNLDLALICKKRVAYMNLMTRLINDGVMEHVKYDGDAIASVNAILRKNGFETACLGCFVESRRLQFQTWAETIVQEWNGEVDLRNKNAGRFNYAKNALMNASSLTEDEIAQLETELKGKKKNKQGNLNLGAGSVRAKMGRLLDQVPTLQKHISVADLLTPEGLTKLRAENPNLFSLVKSRYGAASPKIVQNYNPYASELANLTFNKVKDITNNAVSGANDYIANAKKELAHLKPVRPKDVKSNAFNRTQEMKDWNSKVQTLAMRKYLYDIGGARMQSFSDFMIENIFDYLQIFADLSANRFPLHSYTKEISFLRMFGMTGAKINGSLIAHVDRTFSKQYAGLLPKEEASKGNAILVHTADGDFAIGFDDYARHMATKGTDSETFIQSIGMKDIIALQMDKRYSNNIGSITIGVSDIQILAMLDSPLFRMVIPYHASGMLPQFAKLVGVDLYNDYTAYQNTTVRQYYDLNKNPLADEVDKDGNTSQGKLRNSKGKEIKADTSYNFNAELKKIGDPKTVASNYVAWCNEFHEVYDGKELIGYAKFSPKFSNSPYGTDFTKHENYYKLLEDFNVYDCINEEYTEQNAVEMIFPSEENRMSAQELEEYKQRLRDTGIFTEKEIEKYAKKANMTFNELVKSVVDERISYEDKQNPKFDATVKEIEDNLLKNYKRNGKRLESYDKFKKLKDDSSQSKSAKETLTNSLPLENTYFQDRDSEGNELTPEQAEFFKDSKVRDVEGRLVPVYHGTYENFTVFDVDKTSNSNIFGKGHYFTSNKQDAEQNYATASGADVKTKIESLAYTYFEEMGYTEEDSYDNEYVDEWNEAYDRAEAYYNSGRVVEAYLNIKNPVYADRYESLYDKDGNFVSERTIEGLKALGFDGIIDYRVSEKFDFQHLDRDTAHYIVFDSNQIKSVDNLNPTENEDIRYQDRVTPEEDAEYLELAKNPENNEARLREMVDAAAKRAFPNSKLIQEDGTFFKMWHHTNKEFTSFLPSTSKSSGGLKGIYFTPQEHSSMSALGNIHKQYYLNVENLKFAFGVNDDRAYVDSLRKLQDGVTDRNEIAEINRKFKEDTGVDAFFDWQNGWYNILTPEQIKSADLVTYDDEGNIIPLSERFNEGNEDIRYQDRDESTIDIAEVMGLNKDLEKQNAKLKEDVEYLNELLKLQKQVTNGKMFTKSSVEKMSTMLWHKFGLNRVNEDQKKDLAQRLNAYYSYIAQGEELTWEEVMNRASEIARWADNQIPEKIERDEYAQEILDAIRSVGVRLDDIQKQEVASQYGSYNDFRKANMGSIKLVKDGISLDSQWQEWAKLYPHMFEADINPADMPIALAETIATLKATNSAVEQYDIEAKIRSMAEEIYDGYWGVSTLYTVADKYQKEINLLKGRHTESMNKLRENRDNREKITKDKFNEMLKKVKADKDAELQAYKDLKKEQQQNARDRRNKTAIKNKFKRVVKDLNSILNNGTKERNVKIDLQPTVAKALELAEYLFDDDISNEFILTQADIKPRAEEQEIYNKWMAAYSTKKNHLATIESLSNKEGSATTIANLYDAIAKLDNRMKGYEKQLSSLIAEAKSNINNEGVTNAVNALADAYAELKNSPEEHIKGAYNDGVHDVIRTLAKELSGTKIADMSELQMQHLYDAFKMVLYTVRTSNELFVDGKKMKVEEFSQAILRELSAMRKTTTMPNEKLDKIKVAIDSFNWNEEKPYYAFNKIGSKTLMKLYEEARKAEDVLGRDYDEAIKFVDTVKEKYGYDSWDMDKVYTINLTSGRTIKLSLQELMSIYAYSKREQAYEHMKFGGFVFNDKKFFKETKHNGIKQTVRDMSAEAYTFDDGDLATVKELLRDKTGFVDEMQDFLSTVMGAKGNEISRQLYGVNWFKEKYYFPLKSSHDFLAVVNQVTENYSLRNSGMTKAVVPHAKNPIVLEDFMSVWSNHVGKMSTYHALVLPIDNLNKALSYKGQTISVKSTLKSVFGKSVEDYLDNFVKDLNGGVTSQGATSPLAKMFSKFKKTAVAASTSVVIQQPTAILRAMAYINPKYFVGASDKLNHKDKWNLIKKYAPIAVLKEIGGFDIGGGRQLEGVVTSKSYKGIKKLGGIITDANYRDEVLMRPAGWADEFGWNIIWSAAEREIKATTSLKTGTEEFYQAVGKRFTEVTHKTQVYDSTFTRSAYQRSKSDVVQMAMAFMGEPTTSYNMLTDAVTQAARGNISKGSAAGIIGATVASIVMAAVAKSFVYALRDDDEDESYAEKYASSLTDSLISDLNILNMLPFVKDFVSIFEGWEVERTDMAIFKDIKDALDGLESDSKSPYRKMEDLLGAVASVFGLPLKNLMRTGREMYNAGRNLFDDNVASLDDIGKASSSTIVGEDSMSKVNDLLAKGDTSKAKEMMTGLLNDKIDEKLDEGLSREEAIKKAKSSIRSSLTREWKPLYLEAYANRDMAEMNDIRKLLNSTGIYGSLSELDETLEDWKKSND